MTNKEAIKILNTLYSADVYENEALDLAIKALEKRPQGEWIKVDDNVRSQCSECGFKYADYRILLNFCPNCGAKMTKEAENDNE